MVIQKRFATPRWAQVCAISWAPSVRLCERCIHWAPLAASQLFNIEVWRGGGWRFMQGSLPWKWGGCGGQFERIRGSVFVPHRCVLHGALIQLAFKTLINCRGICLFSVNAISYAECSVNGCLPSAGPAPTSSLLSPPSDESFAFSTGIEGSRMTARNSDVQHLGSFERAVWRCQVVTLILKGSARLLPSPSPSL